jgi:hypothetical protein
LLPAVLAATVTTGCGRDRGGGPKGEPLAVVLGAADRSEREAKVHVYVDGPDGRKSEGMVDLAQGEGTMAVTPRGGSPIDVALGQPVPDAVPVELRRIEYTDPRAVVDLVRHVIDVDPYGGILVRGVGTIRYDVHIGLADGSRFYADVFVDSQNRLRRVNVPEDRADPRPAQRERRLPRLITVDFVYS